MLFDPPIAGVIFGSHARSLSVAVVLESVVDLHKRYGDVLVVLFIRALSLRGMCEVAGRAREGQREVGLGSCLVASTRGKNEPRLAFEEHCIGDSESRTRVNRDIHKIARLSQDSSHVSNSNLFNLIHCGDHKTVYVGPPFILKNPLAGCIHPG